MANCLGYALHGTPTPAKPNDVNYTTLRTAMNNPSYAGQSPTWDAASQLLAKAMAGTAAQKDAGTTFVNAERGAVPALAYHKKTSSDPGTGKDAPLQTIVKGVYTTGGSGEHYFRNTGDGWRGIAASGKPVKPVKYNGTENNFEQEVPDNGPWKGAVNGWWR